MHRFEVQQISLTGFDAEGRILDIGGGGEGIIGIVGGDRVVSIDTNAEELAEAAEGPLKLVMDGRDLTFLDEMFDVVTSFFTMMYVDREDHEAVFFEAYRVLRPGGRFMIWDVELPARGEGMGDVAVFPLLVELPDGQVETGYGTLWPDETLTTSHYADLATSIGFEVIGDERNRRVFYLDLLKPRPWSRRGRSPL